MFTGHEVVAQAGSFDCSELVQWSSSRAATREWITKVKQAVVDDSPASAINKIAEFRLITSQFEKTIFNALETEETEKIPVLLNSYGDELNRIFLGGSDTIPELFQDYNDQITRIFSNNGLSAQSNPRSACGG